jgi:hypothetical protein
MAQRMLQDEMMIQNECVGRGRGDGERWSVSGRYRQISIESLEGKMIGSFLVTQPLQEGR